MRVFKVIEFGGWGSQEEKLVKFVNENQIIQEDIVKIMWAPNNVIQLFYYCDND